MKKKGIRISDEENGAVSVNLLDILKELTQPNQFNWSILYLEAMGNIGENKSLPDFEEEINNSTNGYPIAWDELNELAKKFEQIIDLTLVGCVDITKIKQYKSRKECYEGCDIVISAVDSSFWEVISKDEIFLNKLSKKFKEILWIDSTNFDKI